MINALSLFIGWVLDLLFGDPQRLPHPVVWFGKVIAACEHRLNSGKYRKLKGALTALGLIIATFAFVWLLRSLLLDFNKVLLLFLDVILIFYCLGIHI